MQFNKLYLISGLLQLISMQLYGQNHFIAPVDTPFQLSGTFGELRANHFHSGIDFRTGGDIGKAVCTVQNGWVSRIKVSASGFGNVIYIDHPEGYTSVYGHLHQFSKELTDYVDSAQKSNMNYQVELFPDSGRFSFYQGAFIGWSGNSGDSEAPHVHFEIRDHLSQEPMNPLIFLPYSNDTLAPVLEKIALYSYSSGTYNRIMVNQVSKDSMESFRIKLNEDSLFLGLLVTDPSPPNRLGIYSAEMKIDDSLVFHFQLDRFNFNETRFVNAHTDLLKTPSGIERLHRLYKLPGDSCSIFFNSGNGLILFKDTLRHKLQVILKDFKGNTTRFLAELYSEKPLSFRDSISTFEKISFGKSWKKELQNGFKIMLPATAFYKNEYFQLEASISSDEFLSDIFPVLSQLHTPLHKPGRLTLPINKSTGISPDKIVILRLNEMNKIREVILPDTIINGSSVSCYFRNGGFFTTDIDTTPPVIFNFFPETDPVDRQTYRVCTFTESVSGIKAFSVEEDGLWKLAYLDSKAKKIRWKFEKQTLGPHFISITMTDNCRNTSVFEYAD